MIAWLRRLVVSSVARILARFLFRRIDIDGEDRVPTEGSVLVIANHDNNLIDPMLLLAFGSRPVRFLAKHTLFSHPLVRHLVSLVDAVPVYRVEDGGDPRRNAETLAMCARTLVTGEVIGVFPEGRCHNDSHRRPLKAGTARIAVEAARRAGERTIWVLPVGIHYTEKSRFRSGVALVAGNAIRVDPQESTQSLKRRMAAGLESVTVNAPTWADADLALRRAEVAAGPRAVAPGPFERFGLWRQALADGVLAPPTGDGLPRWDDLPEAPPSLSRALVCGVVAIAVAPLAVLPLALILLPAVHGRRTPDEPATRRALATIVFVPPVILLHGALTAEGLGFRAGFAAGVLTPLAMWAVVCAWDAWRDLLKARRLTRVR